MLVWLNWDKSVGGPTPGPEVCKRAVYQYISVKEVMCYWNKSTVFNITVFAALCLIDMCVAYTLGFYCASFVQIFYHYSIVEALT